MALSEKYGKIDIPNIDDEEPVFILRAQDNLAPAAIEAYKVIAASHGAPVAATLQKEVERFRRWDGRRKIPD